MAILLRAVVIFACFLCCHGAERVLIMRHCVRSMYPTLRGRGDPHFDYADNYTAKPFPTQEEWKSGGVAHCTKRGLELAEAFGNSIREKGILLDPISIIADNISRCIATANQMVKGLGPNSRYDGLTKALDPVGHGVCPPSSPENITAGVQSMINLAESGKGYLSEAWKARHDLMASLQGLAGAGDAPSILDIPTEISKGGQYVGGLCVASQAMIENFILEAGAGISVAWGALDSKKDRRFLWEHLSPLNVLYNRINHNSVSLATRDGAVIIGILQQLLDKSQGSLVLVGHDTNVDNIAALLDLTWSCGPFADNETPPLTGLLFERGADGVNIMVICTALDDSDEGATPGEALVGEVRKGEKKIGTIAIKEVMQEAGVKLEEWGGSNCVVIPCSEPALLTTSRTMVV